MLDGLPEVSPYGKIQVASNGKLSIGMLLQT